MKITKHSDEVLRKKKAEEEANKGCDKCPCCGAPHERFLGSCRTFFGGFLFTKYLQVDCYWCNKCGAEWESDPYEI